MDLGTLIKVVIRHDNSLLRPDWYLDRLEIVNDDTNGWYLFPCERWLSAKKEDQKIERVLFEKVSPRSS